MFRVRKVYAFKRISRKELLIKELKKKTHESHKKKLGMWVSVLANYTYHYENFEYLVSRLLQEREQRAV